jgi:TonB family protein
MEGYMKRNLIILFVSALSLTVSAQEELVAQKSDIRYVKEHLLYQKGNETNVIDVDLEWPSIVDYSSVRPLQRQLSNLLFKQDEDNFDAAYTAFKNSWGNPVTRQFASIPDDSKFCYTDCKLTELGYAPERFISFNISRVVTPASASSQKGDTISKFVTYDIINDKVLQLKDILRTSKLENGDCPDNFIQRILINSDASIQDEVYSFNILDAALASDRMYFRGLAITGAEVIPFTSYVKFEDMEGLLTRTATKLFKATIPARTPVLTPPVTTFNGDSLYTTVDSLPQFRGGREAMMKYMAANLIYPRDNIGTNARGKVVTKFVVDKNGNIQDVRVAVQSSPSMDGEAVRLIKMMPRWIPGKNHGVPVNVSVTLPMTICLQ